MTRDTDRIELWGGIECTVSRIGDDFRDQCMETGYEEGDLERIAALGIKTLRFPILLEKISPDAFETADWSWHDRQLELLQRLGIRVIATLCHHGSGPGYTSLLDPQFPDLLARHAARVAERYPWIEDYTPVNEPLTTARFSCLYGHWYPHATSNAQFLQALVAQCRAIVLSMKAIRAVRPGARLVQTEDLGRVFSTPQLADQAAYENSRRWLSFDLLCGKVNARHPMMRDLRSARIDEAQLRFFRENACKPDIIGINHYLTSDRFLDHRMQLYPAHHHGGNGRQLYADVEAVRCEIPQRHDGVAARLREAWRRYRLPVAVTEVHHGCTRDEQLRWLAEVWAAANAVKAEGADIRAVTIWALLGIMDWNTLLTQRNGIYEPGAFDKRSTPPRPTALAKAAAALAAGEEFDHPVLDVKGWWRREGRHYMQPTSNPSSRTKMHEARKLLIAGGTGTLGQALSRICEVRGLPHVLLSRPALDITDAGSIRAALDEHRPWAVINAAGFVDVARAEREAGACMEINVQGAVTMADECARIGVPLVSFSSDLVFDGKLGRSYVEGDKVNPTGVYGLSKARAEHGVAERFPEFADRAHERVLRAVGPVQLRAQGPGACLARNPLPASNDIVSPTYVPDLAHVVLELLIDGSGGIWHLANPGSISWFEFARRTVEAAGYDPKLVEAHGAQNRSNTSLSTSRGIMLPPLESAIDRYFRDCPRELLSGFSPGKQRHDATERDSVA